MWPEQENYTSCCCHCPLRHRNHDAYRDLNDQIWDNQPIRDLPLPTATVDYSLDIRGVDIADQRRSYYSTQLRVVRSWMPFCFWLLDTTVINSFLLAQQHMGGGRLSTWQSHSGYRERLAWDLVEREYKLLDSTHEQQLQLAEPFHHTPQGNTHASRAMGDITKVTSPPLMPKDPVSHQLIRN